MGELELKIRDAALELGYEKCGIIKVEEMYDYEDRLEERIEKIPMTKGFYSRIISLRICKTPTPGLSL